MTVWAKFLGSYGKDAKDAIKVGLASMDPERWSNASIEEKKEGLREFALKQAEAEANVTKQRKDVVDVNALITSKLSDIDVMEGELKTASLPVDRINLLNGLIAKEVGLIEGLQARLVDEEREVVEAEQDLASIIETVNMLQEQVDMMEQNLSDVRANIARAENEATRLQTKKDLEAQKAGALGVDDTFNLILKKANARVDEINRNNRADAIVAKKAEVSAQSVVAEIKAKNTGTPNVTDRLAAIRAKAAV